MDAEKSYREGRDAFEHDFGLADNPYPSLTGDWHDWQRGWCDAQDEELGEDD